MSHSFPSFKSPCCYLNIILLVTTSVTAVFFFALASNDSWLNGNLFNLQLKDENTQTFHHHQTVQVDSSSLVEKKHFDQITSPSHQHFWIEDADDETIEHLLSQRSDKITKEQSNVNRCHQSSVASCGLMMMKAFKFLRFFPTQEIFTHKCALRSVSTLY